MAKLQKLKYDLEYFYSVGDVVLRRYNTNNPEFDNPNIDYTKEQVIIKEEKLKYNNTFLQILYFESCPDVPHNAYEFNPHGKTLEEYKTMKNNIKQNKVKKEKNIKDTSKQIDNSNFNPNQLLDKLKNKTNEKE